MIGAVLPRLQLHHCVARDRIGAFKPDSGTRSEIAAVAGSLGIFGVLHGERGEVVAAVETVEIIWIFFRASASFCALSFWLWHLRVRRWGDDDLRQMVLRFNEIEFGPCARCSSR